jgi:hypothetical protein
MFPSLDALRPQDVKDNDVLKAPVLRRAFGVPTVRVQPKHGVGSEYVLQGLQSGAVKDDDQVALNDAAPRRALLKHEKEVSTPQLRSLLRQPNESDQ